MTHQRLGCRWRRATVLLALLHLAFGSLALAEEDENPQGSREVEEWVSQGKALTQEGKYSEALTHFDRALEREPENQEFWKLKGYTLYAAQRYTEAMDAFSRGIRINPEDTGALNGLALSELALKKFSKAADVLMFSYLQDKSNFTTLRLAAGALTGARRYEEAVQLYTALARRNPNDVEAWKGMGTNLYSLGRYDEAVESFDRALDLAPNMPDALSSKGSALVSLTEYKKALEQFDKALEINPIYSRAWYNKGVALQRLGRHEEAQRCFRRTLAVQPGHSRARDALEKYTRAVESPQPVGTAPVVSAGTPPPQDESR